MRVKLFRIKRGYIVYVYKDHFKLFFPYAAGLPTVFPHTPFQSCTYSCFPYLLQETVLYKMSDCIHETAPTLPGAINLYYNFPSTVRYHKNLGTR